MPSLPTTLNLTKSLYIFTPSLYLVETEGFSLISLNIRVYVLFWNCLETHWCCRYSTNVSRYHEKKTSLNEHLSHVTL